MKISNNEFNRFIAKVYKVIFLTTETTKSNLSFKPRLKILFSNKLAWQQQLIRSFLFSRHRIVFGPLSDKSIRHYDLVVPLTIDDVKYLANIRHLMKDSFIPIPTIESIELCHDKFLFNQTLVNYGFGDYVPKIANNLGYPYVFKKKIDEFWVGTHIISNIKEEQALFKCIKRLNILVSN